MSERAPTAITHEEEQRLAERERQPQGRTAFSPVRYLDGWKTNEIAQSEIPKLVEKLRSTMAASNGKAQVADVNESLGYAAPNVDPYEIEAPAEAQRLPQQEVFRAKDARPLGDTAQVVGAIDRLSEAQGARMDRLDGAIERVLTAVREHAPTAVIAPTVAQSTVPPAQLAAEVAKIIELHKLKVTALDNGVLSYRLPMDNVRAAVAELAGYDREAFREYGAQGTTPHIEVTGVSDRQVAAAMAFAKNRWEGDAVVIHAEGKHREQVVKHAVRAGLTIDTSRDPEMAAAVAKERERQANPLTRDRSEFDRAHVPMLERVPAQGRSR